MSRLLIVSDSPALSSGLARVTRELASRFQRDGVQVVVAGWSHVAVERPAPTPYPVAFLDKGNPRSLGAIMTAVRPNMVLAIGDTHDFQWLAGLRAEYGGFRLAGYLNVEAAPVPPAWEQILDAFDVLTTTSEFGAQTVARSHVRAIHHGVDRKVFRPGAKPDTETLGRDLRETFVVLLNAQNTQRKNLTTALQAFAIFARGKKDVICYANTQALPMAGDFPGVNLEDAVIEFGVEELVAFNPNNVGPHQTVPDAAMNAIYGFSDALLVTSMAEGFGLPLLEAMATKTVPIAPAAFSATELLADGRGELYPVAATVRGPFGTDYSIVRPDHVAEALERVYRSWRDGDMESYHQAGQAFAASRTWGMTYRGLVDAMRVEPKRVADGRSIDTRLRLRARRIESPFRQVAVVKLGGLGDMLQTTVVVKAAAQKYGTPVVVVTNAAHDVFRYMPEVARVIETASMPQDQVIRSIADEFKVTFDVRYVSRVYGEPPSAFAEKHAWYYDNWLQSCGRLGDLGMHTTEIMLASCGLEAPSIRPTYLPRMKVEGVPETYVAIATGVGTLGQLKAVPSTWWAELIEGLHAQDIKVVQVGGVDDPSAGADLDARDPSIMQQASVIGAAYALIAPEGGMVHLAAAVGTPAVVLFGPTDIALFGYPWNVNLTTRACRPCWWGPGWETQTCTRGASSCLNIVPPAEALDAALKIVRPPALSSAAELAAVGA